MNKLNEQKIKITIKKIRPMPTKIWQDRTLQILNNLKVDVTEKEVSRISFDSLFYFLKKPIVNIKLTIGVVIAGVAVLVGGSMITAYAAEGANPGDFLYPVDVAVENLQRNFIIDPIAKAEFEIGVLAERVNELKILSNTNDKINSASAVGEVDAQQIRLELRLQELDQLRLENKIQLQDQQKVLEQLKTQTKLNGTTMEQIQQEMKQNGNMETQESLMEMQSKFTNQVGQQISDFEQSTGVSVQEAEQNAGTETQIQNQNQIQNNPTFLPEDGSGSGNGNDNNNGTQQNGGGSQQGGN